MVLSTEPSWCFIIAINNHPRHKFINIIAASGSLRMAEQTTIITFSVVCEWLLVPLQNCCCSHSLFLKLNRMAMSLSNHPPIIRYVDRTSVLAFPRVFLDFAPKWNRAIWLVVFVTGVLATAFHLYTLVMAFLAYDVAIEVGFHFYLDMCTAFAFR